MLPNVEEELDSSASEKSHSFLSFLYLLLLEFFKVGTMSAMQISIQTCRH